MDWKIIRFLPEIQFEKQVALHVFRYCNDHFELHTRYIENHFKKHNLFSDKEWIKQVATKYCTRDYILSAISSCLSDGLRKDKEIACILGKVLRSLMAFDDSIKSDRDVVLKVVRHNATALTCADGKFMNDFEILCAAVRNNSSILYAISNIEFLKYWIKKRPLDYKKLSSEMQANPDLALMVVKEGFFKLNSIPQNIISQEMVLEALKIDPTNLQYARNFLKDKTVFIEAVKQSPSNIVYADSSLRTDKDFILQLIEINPNVMRNIDYPLNDDVDIARQVVQRNGLLLHYFSASIRENIEIVKMAIGQNPNSIQSSLIQTLDIVMDAVQTDGTSLQYIYSKFKDQREVVLTAVRQNGIALKFVQNSWKMDREIIIKALNNGCPFMYVDPSWRRDKEIALVALSHDSRAFKLIDLSIRNDEEIQKSHTKSTSFWTLPFYQEKTC
ncbi:predicted protein [Naegleria gruberi]|uniref:Predicted protein n=1 Tax=Naegleria gruberi TaxID=5762 RepID=D2W0H0_NAEGR|nr:uncharacterized protein NAEGRDRAFT_74856 [Naegleria gruberi]EFC37477.1 predicted protein [Naegleria gruberi]|eukprot:XP_002670221.1 predicted protein [Naegleria gruberi strain NEG-M]